MLVLFRSLQYWNTKNGLVLSNTHVPVSGTWSILFPFEVNLSHLMSTCKIGWKCKIFWKYNRKLQCFGTIWNLHNYVKGHMLISKVISDVIVLYCNIQIAEFADSYIRRRKIKGLFALLAWKLGGRGGRLIFPFFFF